MGFLGDEPKDKVSQDIILLLQPKPTPISEFLVVMVGSGDST
jgi:hypothetical protein